MFGLRAVLGVALAAVLLGVVGGIVPTADADPGAWPAVAVAAAVVGLGLAVIGARDRRRLRDLHQEQKLLLADLESRFSRLASTDPDTGLGNHVRLVEDLRGFAARFQRYGQSYSLAVLEVDDLDGLEARGGDRVRAAVVQAVAGVVLRSLRLGDASYRLPGDRIVCLFPATDITEAAVAVERIATSVRMICVPHVDGVEVPSLSACVTAGAPDDGVLANALTSLASWRSDDHHGVVVDRNPWAPPHEGVSG